MRAANKKAAAAATTATEIMKSLTSSTSNATVKKAAADCNKSDILACVALMMALIATALMEWHPIIALMILMPAAGMAIASSRFTQCSISAVKSQPENAPSRTAGMWATVSPAPSTARLTSRSTGRISMGETAW